MEANPLPKWNSVPFRTVPSYVTRNELSSTIDKNLGVTFENSSLPHALVIHGLGGAGKTQLVLRFIEDHRDQYSPILWIDAKSPETVRLSFDQCAGALRLPTNKDSRPGPTLREWPAIESVHQWLRARDESDEEWLVVIDDADNFQWNIEEIIPQGPRGNVIITSQHSQPRQLLQGQYERLHVPDMMERGEAITLLLKHLNMDPRSAPAEVQETAGEIIERLGGLALAVDMVGAYIGDQPDRRVALQQYRFDYDRHKDTLLQQEPFYRLSSYEKTVWTVWDTTLETIERRYPKLHARDLLTFLAYFDRGNIQDELFRLASLGLPAAGGLLCSGDYDLPKWLKKFLDASGQEWDSFHYQQALDLLKQYSLLRRVEGDWPGVTMHGLVQWRAKKHQSGQLWDKWYLVFTAAASWQILVRQNEPPFRRYLATHLPVNEKLDVWKWRTGDENEESIGFIWGVLGRMYYDEGQLTEAAELFMWETETRIRLQGERHPNTLTSLANLASTYNKQGRWKEAANLFIWVAQMMTTVLTKEHPDTLNTMANLASTYRNLGQWKEAEELSIQVMEIMMKVLGKEHPSTLNCMSDLGLTYLDQGRWKEAQSCLCG